MTQMSRENTNEVTVESPVSSFDISRWRALTDLLSSGGDLMDQVFIQAPHLDVWLERVSEVEGDEFARLGHLPEEGWLNEEARVADDGSLVLFAIHPDPDGFDEQILSMATDAERLPKEIAASAAQGIAAHQAAIKAGLDTSILLSITVPPEGWIWSGDALIAPHTIH